jgi:nucleotide-binding universal stress UspA family protein
MKPGDTVNLSGYAVTLDGYTNSAQEKFRRDARAVFRAPGRCVGGDHDADQGSFAERQTTTTEVRHQVKAADVLVEADGSAGDRLIALAKERGADLIVAGAYGHSRVREWIFGGVTRDLLTKTPICCLMAN